MRSAVRWIAIALVAAASGCRRDDPPAAIDRESTVRACVLLEGCGYSAVDSFATGLVCADALLGESYGLRPTLEEVVRCLLAAGEGGAAAGDPCPAVSACLNGGEPAPACAAGPTACEGEVVVGCAAGWRTAFDCAAVGQLCVTTNTGAGECGRGSCDPMTFASSCDGTVIEQCNANGVVAVVDCGVQALTCLDGAGAAYCAGTGAACDPATFAGSCSGAAATYCSQGFEATVDCAALFEDHTCQELAPGVVDCVPAAGECTDIADDACVGNEIVVCVDQRLYRYDCASFGFSTCVLVNDLPYCQ